LNCRRHVQFRETGGLAKISGFRRPDLPSDQGFPVDERFGLSNQIRRAATSISANIAEGAARSPADFAKFIGYATGSLYEVITHATVARNEGFLIGQGYEQLYRDADEISRMLSGLRKSLE